VSSAVLSIGSNIGDRLAHLQSVCVGLGGQVVRVSRVYATEPWGGVEQQDFLNAVLLVDDPSRTARDWLAVGQQLENEARRIRDQRWGPRTLDVDVVSVVDGGTTVVSEDPVLTLPHPRAAERAFVLIPWLDVDPDAVLHRRGADVPVTTLLAALTPADRDGVRLTDHTLMVSRAGAGDRT
jgi:2-amino-4-hydroxy-6-hydroxymethyldihydropteridine diphosphokinase